MRLKSDTTPKEVLELLEDASEVIGGRELSGVRIHKGMIPLIRRAREELTRAE